MSTKHYLALQDDLDAGKIEYEDSPSTPYEEGTIGYKTTRLSADIADLEDGKEDTTNKVTSLSASSTDTQYPSAKCVYDLIGSVETLLGTGVIS